MIPLNTLKSGLTIALLSILALLCVNTFFYDTTYFDFHPYQYFHATLITYCFVFIFLYASITFYTLYELNKEEAKDFKTNFRQSFITLFIGGFTTIIFIYFYMNYINPEAIPTIAGQMIDNMLAGGEGHPDYEKYKAAWDKPEYRNTQVFSLNNIFQNLLPLLIFFYLFLSFLFALFFRKK